MNRNDLHVESVTLCTGIEKTGKTTELVAGALRLAESGAGMQDILVFACSPDAEDSLRERLARTSKLLEGIRVTTPRSFALEILANPDIRKRTGREARMLTRFEESFLAEDLRTGGIAPKRIASMMGFFRKSFSEMADDDSEWLGTQEERELFSLLESRLSVYGAYLEPQLADTAVQQLRSDRNALAAARVPHVLIDDYHLLSRASQHLACLAAGKSLFATSNPEGGYETFDSYPYAQGTRELLQAAPHAQVIELNKIHLPKPQINALSGLSNLIVRASEAASADSACQLEGSAQAQKATTSAAMGTAASGEDTEPDLYPENRQCRMPEDEFAAIGSWAQTLIENGAQPNEIAVVAPNRTWARNIAAALSRRGIACATSYMQGPIGGDIRYLDLSQAAQFVSLLTLVANPEDGPALRAWCGVGEYLTCRSLFAEIMDACKRREVPLASILTEIANAETEASAFTYASEQEHVASRLALLSKACADLEGRRGKDLIDALVRWTAESSQTDATLPHAIAGLLVAAEENDGARTLARKIRQAMDSPRLSRKGSVAIVEPQRIAGLTFEHAAITGMVNGFTPPHASFDRTKTSPQRAARMVEREARLYRSATAAGTRDIAIFHCASMKGTDAQMLGACVGRYFVENGMRCARLSRSLIADAMLGESVQLER